MFILLDDIYGNGDKNKLWVNQFVSWAYVSKLNL